MISHKIASTADVAQPHSTDTYLENSQTIPTRGGVHQKIYMKYKIYFNVKFLSNGITIYLRGQLKNRRISTPKQNLTRRTLKVQFLCLENLVSQVPLSPSCPAYLFSYWYFHSMSLYNQAYFDFLPVLMAHVAHLHLLWVRHHALKCKQGVGWHVHVV